MDECRPTFTGSLTCGRSFGLEAEEKRAASCVICEQTRRRNVAARDSRALTLNRLLFFFFSFQAFPDNAVRREVEHLSAVCINENCTWKGSIKEYEVRRRLTYFHDFLIALPFV